VPGQYIHIGHGHFLTLVVDDYLPLSVDSVQTLRISELPQLTRSYGLYHTLTLF
jgi:hypothetical protein